LRHIFKVILTDSLRVFLNKDVKLGKVFIIATEWKRI